MSQTTQGRTTYRAPEPAEDPKFLWQLDWILIIAALGLSVLGVILVWSATQGGDDGETGRRQAVSLVLALVLALILARVNPRVLRTWAIPIYALAVAGLLLTFSPLGIEVAGARAWIALPGGITIQPSEFAKLALIVMGAAILSRASVQGRHAGLADVGLSLAVALPLAALVIVQRDSGSAMVMGCILAVMLLISGASWKILLPMGLAIVGAVYYVLNSDILPTYQVARLTAFMNPDADPLGAGHNTLQARIAIGSGGLTGQGLGEGTQTQGGFVPVNESDFIYTVAVEELGMYGGVAIIVLLSAVIWRGLVIAFRTQDTFGRCMAAGVVGWFAFQGFESIGMALGITPVTGITLPFVSYGGTSMIATWLGIGLLLAIRVADREQRRKNAEDATPSLT
ncbi:MAG: rod shape-determining protein RodA [Actinomycetia bacterium]|nr:rod shape-determining protein RodA [Actinomycetes bacterium]